MQLKTGQLILADLRRQAHSDGRLHIAVSACTAALTAIVLSMTVDAETGYYSLRTLLHTWPWALGTLALAAAGLYYFYEWASPAYAHYCAWTLVDSGLLYLALEHEPAEALRALAQRERFSRGGSANASGGQLSFAQRMQALAGSYAKSCYALGFEAWPPVLRWLDLGLVGSAALGALWILGVFFLRIYPWLRDPYGRPPGFEITTLIRPVAVAMLLLVLLRGTLRRARTDGVRVGLADALDQSR